MDAPISPGLGAEKMAQGQAGVRRGRSLWSVNVGRRKIPTDQVLANPLRHAIVVHLAHVGGHATCAEICRALGIPFRGSVAWSAGILVRAGLVRKHIAGTAAERALVLTITPHGRAALAGNTSNNHQRRSLELTA